MTRRAPGDHFSAVAASYSQFRPTYPRELFEYVASIAPRHGLLWECGAGSGQATVALAGLFDRVIATDVSEEQISRAPAHPRIDWLVAPAERVPIQSGTVDCVAVAQALHWFDVDRFFGECRRVAAPGAAFVAWTYGAPAMEGEMGRRLRSLMYDADWLGPYWPPERKHIESEYRTIPFPFERLDTPRLELVHEWPREQVIGYLRSMSATARYIAATGVDPVDGLDRESRQLWPDGSRRRIAWPLIVIAGVISG